MKEVLGVLVYFVTSKYLKIQSSSNRLVAVILDGLKLFVTPCYPTKAVRGSNVDLEQKKENFSFARNFHICFGRHHTLSTRKYPTVCPLPLWWEGPDNSRVPHVLIVKYHDLLSYAIEFEEINKYCRT